MHSLHDGRELVFRKCKDHADGLDLSDDHQPRSIRRSHVIPRIDQPQAHPAGYGRGDVAINEVKLGGVNLRLVRFDDPFVDFTNASCVASCCSGTARRGTSV